MSASEEETEERNSPSEDEDDDDNTEGKALKVCSPVFIVLKCATK